MATNIIDFAKIKKEPSPRQAIRQWQKRQPATRARVETKDFRIKAVPLSQAALKDLHDIATSDDRRQKEGVEAAKKSKALLKGKAVPRAAKVRRRGGKPLSPPRLFGTLYTAFSTYEYLLLRNEYQQKRALAGASLFAQARVDARWRQIVISAQTAFRVAGLAVNESTLNGYVQQLQSNGAYYNSVVKLWNAAVPSGPVGVLSGATPLIASFIPTVATLADPVPATTSTGADLCATPLKQGSFTKHLSNSVTLTVRIRYWCPKWSDWTRMCTKTVTLASVSFSVDINVGYKITCCGATAWGQASTQVCASLLFLSACAGCTGSIVGVAGVSRTPVAGGCSYGLGITASLRCVLAGITILNVSYSFGWVITGPCPPANVCA